MAIVQVSRITNRKGLTENLPQLAGAELGWCIDSRRLFIGNGTLEEGAPIVGNTEILTEFSDITALSSYTYIDSAVGYAAQTGPTPSDPVIRTVQAKLDDFASVRDFGAVGNGVVDDTVAIMRALFQLYCRANNTQPRRTLYFPAGTYLVTSTIVIPTWAKLQGEGANCTFIKLDVPDWVSTTAYAAGTTVYDSGNFYIAKIDVPGTSISLLNTTYWDPTTQPLYVAEYGDSLQQVGINIGSNGATPPRNIEISSMTFQSSDLNDVFLVEDAYQCYFDSVNFIGPITSADIVTNLSTDNIAGIRFNSTASIICNQITFDKCLFSNLTYGINTDEQIESITVSNSKFDTLYQGIVLGEGTVVNGGPTGFRAIGNMFDNVYAEGVVYDAIVMNATAHNVFYDVATEFTGTPAFPVIRFGYDNNVSISDMFERVITDSNTYPRVQITGTSTTTGTLLQLGRYSRLSGRTFTLANNVTNQPIFSTKATTVKAYSMNYTIVRNTAIRHGVLNVVSQDTGDSSLTLSYTDDYNENIDTGVTLDVVQSGTTVTVRYTTTNTGSSGILTYSIAHLA